MSPRAVPLIPVAAGLICGVLSTTPSELRFLPSMLLWGGVGAVVGLFAASRDAIRWGMLYGVSLLVGFFASRVAVSTKSLHSFLFVVLAIVLTPGGAVVAVSAGSRLRRRDRTAVQAAERE